MTSSPYTTPDKLVGIGQDEGVALPADFLPLATYPEKRFGYDGLVFCGNGHSIFNASHHYPSPQAGQIAAFIVRACNSHYELLEALRFLASNAKALGAFEFEVRAEVGNTNWQCLMDGVAAADAAITKATGAA